MSLILFHNKSRFYLKLFINYYITKYKRKVKRVLVFFIEGSEEWNDKGNDAVIFTCCSHTNDIVYFCTRFMVDARL